MKRKVCVTQMLEACIQYSVRHSAKMAQILLLRISHDVSVSNAYYPTLSGTEYCQISSGPGILATVYVSLPLPSSLVAKVRRRSDRFRGFSKNMRSLVLF